MSDTISTDSGISLSEHWSLAPRVPASLISVALSEGEDGERRIEREMVVGISLPAIYRVQNREVFGFGPSAFTRALGGERDDGVVLYTGGTFFVFKYWQISPVVRLNDGEYFVLLGGSFPL